MLEEKIDLLIAALDRNTAARNGDAAATATTTRGPGRPPKTATAETTASKYTFEAVKAALVKVKDIRGKPAAQKIIKDVGKVDAMTSIKPPQYQAVMKACEAALEDEAEEEAEEEEDEDSL